MERTKIVWNKSAVNQFENAIAYIRNDSPANAAKVKKGILNLIDSLLRYPERYPADKDKINDTNKEYRAFEKYRLRISYFISEKEIIIIRVRHTRQNPQSY